MTTMATKNDDAQAPLPYLPYMTTTSLAGGHPVPPADGYRWMGCSPAYTNYPEHGDNSLRISHFWQLRADAEVCSCGHSHEDHQEEDGFKGPFEVPCQRCDCDGYKGR